MNAASPSLKARCLTLVVGLVGRYPHSPQCAASFPNVLPTDTRKRPWNALMCMVITAGLALAGVPGATFHASVAHAAVSNTYAVTDLGTLRNYAYTQPTAINNSGEIVGWVGDSPSATITYPFIYIHGKIADLSALGPGLIAKATGINDSGQIVGSAIGNPTYGPYGGEGAVLASKGMLTDLPGWAWGATGINNAGQVVGLMLDPAHICCYGDVPPLKFSAYRALLYSGGQITDLGNFNSNYYDASFATGINDSGQIIGDTYLYMGELNLDQDSPMAVLYSSGASKELLLQGDYMSHAAAINASGQVVGWSYGSNGNGSPSHHAFLYSGGSMVNLGGLFSGAESWATAVNSAGQIVGFSSCAGFDGNCAVLYRDNAIIDLNTVVVPQSGWKLEKAVGIDNAGEIVGTGLHNGQPRAFLLTPPIGDLSFPVALAFDSADYLYIADSGNNRLVRQAPDGTRIVVATPSGSQPAGIAVAKNGTLYMSDSMTKKVLELLPGSTSWMPLSIKPLSCPSGLATDGADNLYIADGCNSQVVKLTFTATGPVQTSVGGNPFDPDAVAVDAAGNVYIASFDGNEVIKVSPSGKQITLGINLYGPGGLAVDSAGTVYISDYFHARVLAYTSGGTGVQFRLPAPGLKELNHPSGLAVDSHGSLYVADFSNNRVVSWTNPGVNPGWSASEFSGPVGVAVDAMGNTFVADSLNNRIVEVTASTHQHSTVLGAVSLDRPDGVAIDSDGTLYVADTGNARVVRVSAAGVENTMPFTGLGSAYGIAVGGNHTVYVADEANNQVLQLVPLHKASRVSINGLDHPVGVAVDKSGNLFVSTAYTGPLATGAVIELSTSGKQRMLVSGMTYPSVGVASDGAVFASDYFSGRVEFLYPGSSNPQPLPVTGLARAAGLAVDKGKHVYITDDRQNRVIMWISGGNQSYL